MGQYIFNLDQSFSDAISYFKDKISFNFSTTEEIKEPYRDALKKYPILKTIPTVLLGYRFINDEISFESYTQQFIEFCETEDIIFYIGPLSTWYFRSKKTKLSCFFCFRDDLYSSLIKKTDEYANLTLEEFKESGVLKKSHYLEDNIPQVLLSNIYFVGGEACASPKHFAYFLPENFGVKSYNKTVTLIFVNTYNVLLEVNNIIMDKCFDARDIKSLLPVLLVWFRGHDCGHSLTSGKKYWKSISRLYNFQITQTLAEALADVFGVLTLIKLDERNEINLGVPQLTISWLSEVFRYSTRNGITWSPDLDAALIQVNYLVKHDVISFTETGEINVDFSKVKVTLCKLLSELSEICIDGKLKNIESFMDNYLDDKNALNCLGHLTENHIDPDYSHFENLKLIY